MPDSSAVSTALLIGRFQPFHKGHLYLLQTALERADRVVIAIGSANSTDGDKNPLPYEQRSQMISTVIAKEGWQEREITLVPSNDFPTDEAWLTELLANVGPFDICFGNNDWTNSVLRSAGYQAEEIPLANREEWQGEVIRGWIRSGNSQWKAHVPEYLVQDIQKIV